MEKITVAWLRERGACADQVATVEREWPQGTPLTVAAALRAQELRLDVEWLINQVPLSLRAEYEQAEASLLVLALRAM